MQSKGTSVMGRIKLEITVANNQDVQMAQGGVLPRNKVRQVRLQGIVDTGASYLVLPTTVAKDLGLRPAGKARVRFADMRTGTRAVVEEARVELLGRHGTFKAILEPKRKAALIGAIVLEDLDLVVDCRTQTVRPRDPKHIIAEIE